MNTTHSKKQTIGIKCSVLYQYLNQKYIDRKTGELSDGIYLLAMYLRKKKKKSYVYSNSIRGRYYVSFVLGYFLNCVPMILI